MHDEIEELADMIDIATSVYTNWDLDTDCYNYVSINAHANRWVSVAALLPNSLMVTCGIGSELEFSIEIPARGKVAQFVLVPMIEQHLNGDRQELKAGLSDYLNISPAIN
jgi:hypothetical protein